MPYSSREEDAVKQALTLWEDQERRRLEILSAVSKAEASLARGEGRTITSHEQVTQLAADIKNRGMAYLLLRTRSFNGGLSALCPSRSRIGCDLVHIARNSTIATASRVTDAITERFWLLGRHP